MQTKLHDIYSLTLGAFINAYCDHDFSGLVISGEPTSEELKLAWSDILQAYNDGLMGDEMSDILFLQRRIAYNQIKCQAIDLILYRLCIQFDSEIWKELAEHIGHFDFSKIDTNDQEDYLKGLQWAIDDKRRLIYDIDEMGKELQRLSKGQSGQIEMSKNHFSRLVVVLSEHNGYYIDRNKIITSDFVEMIAIVRKKIEKAESSQQK
ncbi:MAG TPA: hypothetical protein VFW07_01360 [Parafilimonas sp.]|nr:hypothetical protein [Parafilimonas sp.]